MSFSAFLKKQLLSFVEVYEQYFFKTIGVALLWTVLCMGISQVLAAYCSYDPSIRIQPVSILSFMVLRFSANDVYSLVDLTKTVFIFFTAIFSLHILQKATVKNVIYLVGTMVVCALLDCALFRAGGQLTPITSNQHLLFWVNGVIHLLRIYLPLLLFALIIQVCVSEVKFTFQKLLYLFVALWLFNEMSYELLMLMRANVFDFILFPFKTQTYRYVGESLLGIPLMACFFLGYYCAMVMPFKLAEERSDKK